MQMGCIKTNAGNRGHVPMLFHIRDKITIYDMLTFISATHQLGCAEVNQPSKRHVHIEDLCWMDKHTLIVADAWVPPLVKYTINTTAKTCEGEPIHFDHMHVIHSVSCLQDKVYVSRNVESSHFYVIEVGIYDLKTGIKEVWNTNIEIRRYGRVSLSFNEDLIVISSSKFSYLFNTERVLQYKVRHAQDHSYVLPLEYVTNTGMFWYFDRTISKFGITNLFTNEKNVSDKGNAFRAGISGTRNGYVYVLVARGFDMYSHRGILLYHINGILRQINQGYETRIAAISISDDEALIAVTTGNDKEPVAIFKIHE